MNPPRSSLQFAWPLAVALAAVALSQPAGAATSPGTNTPARASAAGAPTRVDASTFKVVTDRNIFNANRTARGVPAPPRDVRRPTRVDSFGLVGTMESAKGPVAFFDGSSSEYRKALKPDASIAGWKLTEVSLQSVKLTAGTNTLTLPVGHSLRREDEGEWQPASGTEFAASGSGGGSSFSRDSGRDSRGRSGRESSASGVSSPAGSAPSADAAEVLRKMMERRAKEEQ